ncbi:23S rRNA (uracil(1939)-C(5))-methyltransferase RlmD [Leptospira idonii]|uniref:23S rRNA (Uracil(1939)-C(5))-methyltransferase RlmD n=1 Tax=Leptospira idonii TaxID=1193500 RepID=A0A4R9M337_9LEPT|nr:23S rRNA (uracil(1939)-C(5))-methyltransferase RlmD [Leptospira idonii]TGN20401.1 23S rRNA (uracil(1939)-C(5))-methyltransferase RlmD [Leptospira idonii]
MKSTCTHFGLCGGCSNLNTEYGRELKKKEQVLKDYFSSYRHVQFRPIVASPNAELYRHKLQLPFGRRTIGRKTITTLGLFNQESTFIVDQTECLIQEQGLTEIGQAVKLWARKEGLPPYNEKSKRGILKYLVARKSFSTKEIIIGIVTNGEELPYPKDLSKRLHNHITDRIGKSGKFGKLVGIVQNINSKHSSMALGKEENLLWGRPYIHEFVGKFKFRVGLSTFLQVNPSQTPSLYNLILDEIQPGTKVIDAYSGIGTISLWLSGAAKEVVGLEENPNSHRTAIEALKTNHIKNVRYRKGRVSETLPTVLGKDYSTIVLDPPRIGLGEEVANHLVHSNIQKIVYVSCDPKTLLDDTRVLSNKYYLASVQPVDMFPRTDHLETVAVFTRKP